MKIVADSTIPFIEGVFEPYADVVFIEGSKITRDDILDADALLIRTWTRCDASLLEGTPVKLISMATMGIDNIDLEYCSSHGIYVQNASGSVAGGVMNYVFSALYGMAARRSISLSGKTFGIIGVGDCGARVESMARSLGFKVMLCDKRRALTEGPARFSSMDDLLAGSDIVSLHLPLDSETRGVADAAFFSKMKVGAFFINTAHGELVDEDALIQARPKLGPVILDTWCGEPDINVRLLRMTDIATPHIAGYSYQGKQKATAAAVRSLARFFGIQPLYDFFPATEIAELKAVRLDVVGKSQGEITSLFQYNYPVFTDDFLFRMDPSGFERLRSSYKYRREFFID